MEFIIFCLIMFIWLQRSLYKEPIIIHTAAKPDRTGTWWKVTFKAKRTPPLEIEGDSEPLVLRKLMAKQINYKDILTIERLP